MWKGKAQILAAAKAGAFVPQLVGTPWGGLTLEKVRGPKPPSQEKPCRVGDVEEQKGEGPERPGAEEDSEKLQLLCRDDMVHYLDVRDAWGVAVCECCFHRAVSQRTQHALVMTTLKAFRSHVQSPQPASIPLAPNRHARGTYEYSLKVPLPEALAQLNVAADVHVEMKGEMAALICAEAMLLEWMAEPRVGVLMDLGTIRSRLPAIMPATECPAAKASPAAAPPDALPATAASPAASALPAAAAAAWSCCWRCSSCFAAYRRAVSFAAFLVLVARSSRFVTLCRAHAENSKAYPAIVSALGAGRQKDDDTFASIKVQILGLKETADLEEGFGVLMQNLLSGGLEKAHAGRKGGAGMDMADGFGSFMQNPLPGGVENAHAEGGGGRGVVGEGGGGAGQMEKDECTKGSWGSKDGGGRDGRNGKGGQWREHFKGRAWERYWARTYGAQLVPATQCCKDSPHGKVRPIRHPLRDLPSLLVRLGAIPKPLDQGRFPLEWEEWPRGDEAAATLPHDPRARFFHLGIVEEANGTAREKGGQGSNAGGKIGTARGKGRDKGKGKREGRSRVHGDDERLLQQVLTELLPLVQRKFPIVRCTADAEFIVEFAGHVVQPPACAQCKQCLAVYSRRMAFLMVVTNYAYRPATTLFNRFVSIFPPLSPEFERLTVSLGLPAFRVSMPGFLRSPVVQARAEKFPVYFLLTVALKCPLPIMGITDLMFLHRLQDGEEEDGRLWEEVQMWCLAMLFAWTGGMKLEDENGPSEGARSSNNRSGSCESNSSSDR
ncbi:unnamed protein product [Closterium sp. NIES-65]|nr:unnamed protein product [Closterium sp. NIES-65]